MPIQKQNRVLKQYASDLSKSTSKDFIDLIEKLVDEPVLKPVLSTSLNLVFEETQITGDVRETRSLISKVDESERPHSFSVSIQTNANPRKTLSISITFAQSLVTFNLQNAQPKDKDELIKLCNEAYPETEKPTTKTTKPGKNTETSIKGNDENLEFLPGAFRPVPMPSLSDRDVFIIMSFQEEYRDTYNLAIKPTIEKMGFNPIRVDEIQHNATVTPEIMRQIERATFVVADLSGERPNVYYEVGYAHRADKEVILMAQKDHAVHFDIASINRINYQDLTELTNALELRIKGIKDRMGIIEED